MNEPTQHVFATKPAILSKLKCQFNDWNFNRKRQKLQKLLDSLSDMDTTSVELEFKSIGYSDINSCSDGDPDFWIQRDVINLLKLFSLQGHSGSSAPYATHYFSQLSSHKPLSPLTGEDWEWLEVYQDKDGRKTYQNRRYCAVFKEIDGSTEECYDINGKVFYEYYTDSKGEQQTSYYTGRDSRTPVTFPYTVPETPEYEHRQSECD
jgi:hypothetical protein